jgi:HemX protein
MVLLLHSLALLSYLLAGVFVAASFAHERTLVPRLSETLLAVGVLVHATALFAFSTAFDELPLVGLAPSFSTLAFLVAVFLLFVTLRGEARPVRLVLMPFIALLLAIALVLGVAPAGEPLAFRGVWFSFHVVLAFIGYAGFAISAGAGVCYLLQFRELKGRHFGRVFRFFPDLPTLDRLGRSGVFVAFPALTLAIGLGWAWAVRFDHDLSAQEPKVAWAMLTWALLAAALLARRGHTEAAKRGAMLSAIGFGVVVATYVVLRLGLGSGRVFL